MKCKIFRKNVEHQQVIDKIEPRNYDSNFQCNDYRDQILKTCEFLTGRDVTLVVFMASLLVILNNYRTLV